jgi:PKD repeat protein
MGEPLYASLTGQAVNTNVAWSSNSGGHIWPTANTDSAIYIFTSPGTYTVKANFQSHINGSNDSTDGNVIVTDSIFSDTVSAICDVIAVKNLTADDQIFLTPVDYSDTGLVFVAHSANLYNHSPLLNSNGEIHLSVSGFEVDISSALIYPCSGSSAPAPAFGLVAITGLTNRTYTLSVKLNNIMYSGTMTVTDSNITFTWTSSSGVTISPLTIQKRTH